MIREYPVMLNKVKDLVFLLLSASLFSCGRPVRRTGGEITPEMLKNFRSAEAVLPHDSAFLHRDLYEVTLDSAVVATLDTACTYRIRTKGMTDQMKSGRCWLFSTFNLYRAEVIKEYALDGFEFSETFGQFYDLLEKCNRWFENVMEYRDEPLVSRMNNHLFRKPVGDGGHFMNAAHILSKYGTVPREIMPEKFSSTDNARLMRTVLTLLRKYGMQLRRAREDSLPAIKEKGLGSIYHLLTQTLGTPPQEFEWMGGSYTPLSFRDKFIRHDPENDYAVLMNDPTLPYYSMYEVDNSRNCYELDNWTFLNLPMMELEDLGIASLKDSTMFYFSCDTYHGDEAAAGLYSENIHDFAGKLGVDLSMNKEERIASGEIFSVHAMAMAGVKLDSEGRPVHWVSENSYGPGRGFGGFIVMDAPWLRAYLFRMAVEKRFLSKDQRMMLESKVTLIPCWNLNY